MTRVDQCLQDTFMRIFPLKHVWFSSVNWINCNARNIRTLGMIRCLVLSISKIIYKSQVTIIMHLASLKVTSFQSNWHLSMHFFFKNILIFVLKKILEQPTQNLTLDKIESHCNNYFRISMLHGNESFYIIRCIFFFAVSQYRYCIL